MSQEITPLQILLEAFPGITRGEAKDLITSGQMRTYPENTTLCREGALETTFYIILDGEVEVTKRISPHEFRLLKTLSAGDFFGEMAIIHEAPRAASVTTTRQTTVLEIRKDAFKNLLRRSASVSLAMVQEVSRRLRENDEMAIEDLRIKAGELASAYQQLAEQEFARHEFLTVIAHELRTPLTAANGFLQMIQKGLLTGQGLDTNAQKAALDSVTRNIEKIVTLVNDILFLQEMDLILPKFKPNDLREVLNSTIGKCVEKAKNNDVQIDMNLDDNIPLISGDLPSLERAFSAILDNAIKFSPNGGNVTITSGYDQEFVWVSIEDQGVGIPEDILPRIFKRFFHIDEIDGQVFGGIGLGLSIAKQVIEQHHGRIEVSSNFGEGTRFSVILPALQEEIE